MSRRKQKLDIKYSTATILKRVFKYALRSKKLIFISLVFLLIYSLLEVVQPLLIKKLLDDELAGVQTTWIEVAEENKYTVVLDGKYYMKEKEGYEPIRKVTIRYFEEENAYLMIEGEVSEKGKVSGWADEDQTQVIVSFNEEGKEDKIYQARKLTVEEMRSFFMVSVNNIIFILIIFAIVSIIILIARFIQHVSFTSASMKLTLFMRSEAFNKLNRLPITYFAKEPHGKTVTKVTYDSEGVQGLYQVVFSIVSASISLVLVYIGLIYLDVKLALLTLIGAPFISLWLTVYRRTINQYNHSIREMNSRINGKLAEFVNGVGIIQLFNKEQVMADEYDVMLKTNYHTKMKSTVVSSLFGWEMLVLLRRLGTAFILLYFGFQYFSPTVVVVGTTIYVYTEYLEKLIGPIADIFQNLNGLEDSLVSASRIFELLDEEEDTGIGRKSDVKFNGNIKFENVSFAYEGDNYVLKNINIDIKANQFVGLVGHTGSGKSTLMSLLERYYDLKEGKIYIDGVDYMTYSKQEVRQNIGIILQDPAIFEGTIKSNITLGEDVPDEEVEKILLEIGGDKFVCGYPQGIHTPVTYMGENLSTGEKQLISFARILLRNPSIIILDEATANIDTETEQLIQNALTILSKNRTTIVIAHRLSTIRNADVIYVLEDGRVVESGTHDELYHKKDGKYRAIYDAQYDNKVVE